MDAEFQEISSEPWKQYRQVLQCTANHEHSFSRSMCSSKKILRIIPRAKGIHTRSKRVEYIRTKLVEFHRKYYSAILMDLCIVSSLPLYKSSNGLCRSFWQSITTTFQTHVKNTPTYCFFHQKNVANSSTSNRRVRRQPWYLLDHFFLSEMLQKQTCQNNSVSNRRDKKRKSSVGNITKVNKKSIMRTWRKMAFSQLWYR